ncbi:MAG: hypothetical protein LBQ27_03160 [Clostridiales bacterium]|jgi:hypothetical protein|nr:hypothetical protein [Clostridiales bacterium]
MNDYQLTAPESAEALSDKSVIIKRFIKFGVLTLIFAALIASLFFPYVSDYIVDSTTNEEGDIVITETKDLTGLDLLVGAFEIVLGKTGSNYYNNVLKGIEFDADGDFSKITLAYTLPFVTVLALLLFAVGYTVAVIGIFKGKLSKKIGVTNVLSFLAAITGVSAVLLLQALYCDGVKFSLGCILLVAATVLLVAFAPVAGGIEANVGADEEDAE